MHNPFIDPKGGEGLGDKEGSEEEKEVIPPDADAGGKATYLRRFFVEARPREQVSTLLL